MPRSDREPEYRRKIREKTKQDQNRAENERYRAAESSDIHEIVLAIKAIDQKYDRDAHENESRHKWDRFWEILGVAGLWLAAAVGIVAICYGTWDSKEQRGIMGGQLDAMMMARRPWISVNVAFSKDLTYQNGSVDVNLAVSLRNTGQSPAIRTGTEIKAFPTVPPEAETEHICREAGNAINMSLGPPIFPAENPIIGYETSITKDQLTAEGRRLRDNKPSLTFLTIIVCVAYEHFKDPKIHHTSKVLRALHAENGFNISLSDLPMPLSKIILQQFFSGTVPPD
jgi:hypothetical protein